MRPATQTPTTTIPDGAGTRSQANNEDAAAIVAKALGLATRAAATLPRVIDLGVHLADLDHAHDAFETMDGLPPGPDACRASWAMDLLSDRRDAIREVIASQPAASMADAAVQIAVLADFAGRIPGGNLHADKLGTMIERLALSILPILAKAADLDLERMAWTYPGGAMRVFRFGGVGVQS